MRCLGNVVGRLFLFFVVLGIAGSTLLFPVYSASAAEQFIAVTTYRTGPYNASGTPLANGMRDYFTLINRRDGGVDGVKITWEECEAAYKTKIGVECYERLKGKGPKGPVLFLPNSTGIAYQVLDKLRQDRIPMLTMGYGRTAVSDGRVFKWAFNFPANYWGQAAAFIRYAENRLGGNGRLRGAKIAHLYHRSAYGRDPIPTLEALAKRENFELRNIPVTHPGLEQDSQWAEIRRFGPDFVFISGWGVMNQTAIKQAIHKKFPVDRLVGNWWAASDEDVLLLGDKAEGYKAINFHGVGRKFRFLDEIVKYVYHGDDNQARKHQIGDTYYNRGALNAMMAVEAIRTAQAKFGNVSLGGEEVRWGLENLNITETLLDDIGAKGFVAPFKVTPENHGGDNMVRVQEWNGKHWISASDWIGPDANFLRSMIEAEAYAYEASGSGSGGYGQSGSSGGAGGTGGSSGGSAGGSAGGSGGSAGGSGGSSGGSAGGSGGSAGGSGGGGVGRDKHAARRFLSRHKFPPEFYGAYGIVAFTASATPATRKRHEMICNAYTAGLVKSSVLTKRNIKIEDQMVTVWPVETLDQARGLNLRRAGDPALCKDAIDGYDLDTARLAINDARKTRKKAANLKLDGRGPFLIAWSPSHEKGQADTIVLVLDLSKVRTAADAAEAIRFWTERIEGHKGLWQRGFATQYIKWYLSGIASEMVSKLDFTGK